MSDHPSSTTVTVWVQDDAYMEQRELVRQDTGETYRVIHLFRADHTELVGLYLTVDAAQTLYELLTTSLILGEEVV